MSHYSKDFEKNNQSFHQEFQLDFLRHDAISSIEEDVAEFVLSDSQSPLITIFDTPQSATFYYGCEPRFPSLENKSLHTFHPDCPEFDDFASLDHGPIADDGQQKKNPMKSKRDKENTERLDSSEIEMEFEKLRKRLGEQETRLSALESENQSLRSVVSVLSRNFPSIRSEVDQKICSEAQIMLLSERLGRLETIVYEESVNEIERNSALSSQNSNIYHFAKTLAQDSVLTKETLLILEARFKEMERLVLPLLTVANPDDGLGGDAGLSSGERIGEEGQDAFGSSSMDSGLGVTMTMGSSNPAMPGDKNAGDGQSSPSPLKLKDLVGEEGASSSSSGQKEKLGGRSFEFVNSDETVDAAIVQLFCDEKSAKLFVEGQPSGPVVCQSVNLAGAQLPNSTPVTWPTTSSQPPLDSTITNENNVGDTTVGVVATTTVAVAVGATESSEISKAQVEVEETSENILVDACGTIVSIPRYYPGLFLPSAKDILIAKDEYVSCVMRDKMMPRWVSEKLSFGNLAKPADRRILQPRFHLDDELVEVYTDMQGAQISYQGFGSGQLAAADHHTSCEKVFQDTFLVPSNLVPQNQVMSACDWARIEKLVKFLLAPDYDSQSHIFIVTGPVFDQPSSPTPSHLFKLLLWRSSAYMVESNSPTDYFSAAFVVENNFINQTRKLGDFLISIPELERRTGLDFSAFKGYPSVPMGMINFRQDRRFTIERYEKWLSLYTPSTVHEISQFVINAYEDKMLLLSEYSAFPEDMSRVVSLLSELKKFFIALSGRSATTAATATATIPATTAAPAATTTTTAAVVLSDADFVAALHLPFSAMATALLRLLECAVDAPPQNITQPCIIIRPEVVPARVSLVHDDDDDDADDDGDKDGDDGDKDGDDGEKDVNDGDNSYVSEMFEERNASNSSSGEVKTDTVARGDEEFEEIVANLKSIDHLLKRQINNVRDITRISQPLMTCYGKCRPIRAQLRARLPQQHMKTMKRLWQVKKLVDLVHKEIPRIADFQKLVDAPDKEPIPVDTLHKFLALQTRLEKIFEFDLVLSAKVYSLHGALVAKMSRQQCIFGFSSPSKVRSGGRMGASSSGSVSSSVGSDYSELSDDGLLTRHKELEERAKIWSIGDSPADLESILDQFASINRTVLKRISDATTGVAATGGHEDETTQLTQQQMQPELHQQTQQQTIVLRLATSHKMDFLAIFQKKLAFYTGPRFSEFHDFIQELLQIGLSSQARILELHSQVTYSDGLLVFMRIISEYLPIERSLMFRAVSYSYLMSRFLAEFGMYRHCVRSLLNHPPEIFEAMIPELGFDFKREEPLSEAETAELYAKFLFVQNTIHEFSLMQDYFDNAKKAYVVKGPFDRPISRTVYDSKKNFLLIYKCYLDLYLKYKDQLCVYHNKLFPFDWLKIMRLSDQKSHVSKLNGLSREASILEASFILQKFYVLQIFGCLLDETKRKFIAEKIQAASERLNLAKCGLLL